MMDAPLWWTLLKELSDEAGRVEDRLDAAQKDLHRLNTVIRELAHALDNEIQ